MPPRGPRENSRRSCLLLLLLLAVVGYYGIDIGETFIKYSVLKAEMRSQAQLAPSITNLTIRRRLVSKIESLGLPQGAIDELEIRRTARPREITIRTEYQEAVDLPFFRRTVTFRPQASARL